MSEKYNKFPHNYFSGLNCGSSPNMGWEKFTYKVKSFVAENIILKLPRISYALHTDWYTKLDFNVVYPTYNESKI